MLVCIHSIVKLVPSGMRNMPSVQQGTDIAVIIIHHFPDWVFWILFLILQIARGIFAASM